MLNTKIEKEINKQIRLELESAYLYLSMSSYLSDINLNGFAHWMRLQYEEEQMHAMKMYDYVIERGGRILLEPISAPQHQWENVVEIFEHTLSHEQSVTARINFLVNLAIEERDHATVNFLQWFIDEQVEEESSVEELLGQLRLIEGKGTGLFMLDREAKMRSNTPLE
jgi:ferritin